MSKGFKVYVDPDEEAFQRSLISNQKVKTSGTGHSTPSVLDRQTAKAKLDRFIEDAMQSLGIEPYRTIFVPFKAELPTYADMTEEQRAYYLYWRREYLGGQSLNADEGYLLCLAYEIINQTLMIGVHLGGELMLRLLSDYGARFPGVARQLVRWIEDYYSEYLTVDALYRDLSRQEERVQEMFDGGRFLFAIYDNEPLDYEDICQLTALSHRRCLFANNWDQMSEFKELLPQAFHEVDRIIRNRTGKSWLTNIQPYSRRAFPGAVYGGKDEVSTTIIDFSPGPQRDVFGRVARLVELLMGQEVGYGNKKMTSNISRLEAQIDDEELTQALRELVATYYR